jgi:hypothetical protein
MRADYVGGGAHEIQRVALKTHLCADVIHMLRRGRGGVSRQIEAASRQQTGSSLALAHAPR